MKTIFIKLTMVGPLTGPFVILDQDKNLIQDEVPREDLVKGMYVEVQDSVTAIIMISLGSKPYELTVQVGVMEERETIEEVPVSTTGTVWKHGDNHRLYNTYYERVEPYIIEYPFAYSYQDEILKNVKDYTRAFVHGSKEKGVDVVETDNIYFNKAILYNGQQCSGMLELVPRPTRDLKGYMTYPRYRGSSKEITFTKSDSFYQYNTFWNVLRDKGQPMFKKGCAPLSIDKELNQVNMDYGQRTFNKAPLRAKELKIRHILDNRGNVQLLSQFVHAPTQISYK